MKEDLTAGQLFDVRIIESPRRTCALELRSTGGPLIDLNDQPAKAQQEAAASARMC